MLSTTTPKVPPRQVALFKGVSGFLLLLSLMLSACDQPDADSPGSTTSSNTSAPDTILMEADEETAWQLEAWEIGEVSVASVPALKISIDLDAQQISGFSGCNNFGGSFTTSGEAVRVTQLRSTQRGCEQTVMEQESQFLKAIQAVEQIQMEEGQLVLLSTVDQTPNTLYFSRL